MDARRPDDREWNEFDDPFGPDETPALSADHAAMILLAIFVALAALVAK